MFFDERGHEILAFRVIHNHQLYASRTHVIFRSAKRTILADHNLRDPVKQHSTTAHIAWRKRRVKHRSSIVTCLEPAGILETIHFGMQDGTSLLNATIVTAANDPAINHQNGT